LHQPVNSKKLSRLKTAQIHEAHSIIITAWKIKPGTKYDAGHGCLSGTSGRQGGPMMDFSTGFLKIVIRYRAGSVRNDGDGIL